MKAERIFPLVMKSPASGHRAEIFRDKMAVPSSKGKNIMRELTGLVAVWKSMHFALRELFIYLFIIFCSTAKASV